ncbi:MAG: RNA polymerase sigma factor [bacterium]|nr:RNA polymerase sigma factor [bacterium]
MEETDSVIYRKIRGDLVRYAASLVGPDGADDTVSTVVLRTLSRRSLGDLDDPKAYLFRAVLNEARTVAKVRGRPVRYPRVPDYGSGDLRPEVLEAVSRLPLRQRAATFLVYWADYSIGETAHAMGSRPGTIKRYLHRARKTLEGVLDEY